MGDHDQRGGVGGVGGGGRGFRLYTYNSFGISEEEAENFGR